MVRTWLWVVIVKGGETRPLWFVLLNLALQGEYPGKNKAWLPRDFAK
jgi:hypothetical protein